jgi:sirohydrochlorin ferrochelatase
LHTLKGNLENRAGKARAIVIVDHGSRRDQANAVVAEVAKLVQARAGERAEIRFAHMELCEPSLAQVLDECAARGAREVTVQPLFLAPGRHATRDIPNMVDAARARHPGVVFHLGEVIGADPLLAELLISRCGLS